MIIVGSGVAGASVAWHLAKAGVSVQVVDAGREGAATAAGAGIVSPWTSRRHEGYPLAEAAGAYYPELAAAVPGTSYEVVGGLVVSASPDELDEAEQRLAGRPAGAVTRLTPEQARELFPPLAPSLAAVHVSRAGRVDGRRLRSALLAASGAELISGRVTLDGGLRVDGVAHGADAVVLAAGAWTSELVDLPVAPQRGQISHFSLPGTDTASWPVVLPVSSHYLLAFPGSRVVAGATRETGSGFDHRVTAAGQAEVLSHALAVAPGLATATLLETRVGFRPASPDGEPLLGQLDENLYVATGFGPGGLTLAPYAGRLVADLVLGRDPGFDLTPYRPDRF
ncbi:D-amino-acid dehydrogenase [Labedaea rhizosphaerae]|uniref:D-amino-acid dehydrogenase n=1 Tax=Labedaea rhizosphaerae TaxID=598644 RepID=A0A4R6SHG0_LABRH|nr:D-amino-acid dehydrogenase [Labedaea rhizosphaerae]